MDPVLVTLLGYVAGCLGRTLYDFLFKALEDPNIVFDTKFITTMLLSMILSFILAMATFSTVGELSGSPIMLFATSLTTGFTVNHVINKGVSYLACTRTK